MKIIFFSDTHGLLSKYFDEINFAEIDLIVFCGDNFIEDFELFKNINIKKIGILGNNLPYQKKLEKIDIFNKFGIEDIAWKKFEYMGKSFFGIDGKISYILDEKMKKTIFGVEEFFKIPVNIVISHFPISGIMDDPDDFSHRGLYFLNEYINKWHPELLVHGHLHKSEEKQLGKTKIIQIFPYKIIEL